MHLFFDLNPDLKSSIFLGGVGRSGTTWVSDVINARNDYRLMFEPFYPEKVPLCRPFRYRQYLRPTDSNTTYLTVGQTILSGKIRNAFGAAMAAAGHDPPPHHGRLHRHPAVAAPLLQPAHGRRGHHRRQLDP